LYFALTDPPCFQAGTKVHKAADGTRYEAQLVQLHLATNTDKYYHLKVVQLADGYLALVFSMCLCLALTNPRSLVGAMRCDSTGVVLVSVGAGSCALTRFTGTNGQRNEDTFDDADDAIKAFNAKFKSKAGATFAQREVHLML
jgi:hypothetical protein